MSFVLTVICLNLVPFLTSKRLFQTRYRILQGSPILHFTKFTLKGVKVTRPFIEWKEATPYTLLSVLYSFLVSEFFIFWQLVVPYFVSFSFATMPSRTQLLNRLDVNFPNYYRITSLLYHIFITERTFSVSTECRAQICILAAIPWWLAKFVYWKCEARLCRKRWWALSYRNSPVMEHLTQLF